VSYTPEGKKIESDGNKIDLGENKAEPVETVHTQEDIDNRL